MLHEHIQRHGLNATVRLTGRLCQDECKLGPNLAIGDELYHGVTAARLRNANGADDLCDVAGKTFSNSPLALAGQSSH